MNACVPDPMQMDDRESGTLIDAVQLWTRRNRGSLTLETLKHAREEGPLVQPSRYISAMGRANASLANDPAVQALLAGKSVATALQTDKVVDYLLRRRPDLLLLGGEASRLSS